jgi:hypothetical protein
MKSCPTCNRTYTDASLNFCLEDGTPLVVSPPPGFDPNATIRYTDPRDTGHPPAEVVRQAAPTYQVSTPVASHGSQFGQQQSHLSVPGPVRKSRAIWWILGGVALVALIGIGAVVMIIALAGMGSNSNTSSNRANVNRLGNRNTNTNTNANTNVANVNANAGLPATTTDDFSTQKWGTGTYDFGDIWYAGAEYHMRAKADKYLVMYAPSQEYKTENATVSVAARSVDGTATAAGYGLIVHGERSASNELEDYALLIYTGPETKYQIVKHKGGKQTAMVPWTASGSIHPGAASNALEVRARGSELAFYINGQYVNRITDKDNFKAGVAGLYTSGTTEVAFDDLEIRR